jgi:hypothetical protein
VCVCVCICVCICMYVYIYIYIYLYIYIYVFSRSEADGRAALEPHPIEEARGFAVTAKAPFVVIKTNFKKKHVSTSQVIRLLFLGYCCVVFARGGKQASLRL